MKTKASIFRKFKRLLQLLISKATASKILQICSSSDLLPVANVRLDSERNETLSQVDQKAVHVGIHTQKQSLTD